MKPQPSPDQQPLPLGVPPASRHGLSDLQLKAADTAYRLLGGVDITDAIRDDRTSEEPTAVPGTELDAAYEGAVEFGAERKLPGVYVVEDPDEPSADARALYAPWVRIVPKPNKPKKPTIAEAKRNAARYVKEHPDIR